jgi:2-hydroxychromene-2-carboxylate isomerase
VTRTAAPEFLFDFGSPNAYLAYRVLPTIEQRTGVPFLHVPVLLGGIFKATNNQSPVQAYAHIPSKLAYEQLEMQRFIARHALHEFKMNPFFPVNTLLIMRGAVAADIDGRLPAYEEAVMRHMWAEPKQMDDPTVVAAALDASGLDAERLLARIREPDVKQKLLANTEAAVARGVFGLPAFFVGDALYFGKDRLRDVEDEIVRVRDADPT